MNRNYSFFSKTFLIANFLLLITSFVLNAQKRLTDFYSTDLSTEFPTNFIEFNGKAYFMASDATHGRNLWTSDGTKAGTRFFLETEPNRPETNQTSYFKTDSILYVFSQQNLWQIDKKQNAKQLNLQPLVITRNIVEFDNKLFFNSIEYYDLKSKSFQKLALNNIKPLTDDNLRYFSECTQSKLRAFNFKENVSAKKNSFYVHEPKQTVCTELSLGSLFSSGVPSKIYKVKDNYFGIASRQGIYKFTPDKEPERVGGYFESILYQNQVGEKLYFLSAQDSQITQYVFDGEKLEQVSNKLYDLARIVTWGAITNDSLFYSNIRLNTGDSKWFLVRLNKSGELDIKFTISDGSNIGSFVKVLNDSLISFAHSPNNNNSFLKTKVVNFKKFTIQQLIDLSGEFILLPNGDFIGQKLKDPLTESSSSIFNNNKNEFLMGSSLIPIKTRPKSLGMWFDILNKTLFVGLNEYDNLKSIYAFKSDSDQGKRILAQQDSSFQIRFQNVFNGGTVVWEDIRLYVTDAGENLSQIYDYTIDYTRNNTNNSYPKVYLYDHLKNTTTQLRNSKKVSYTIQKRTFEIDNDKIREIDSFSGNTLKTYYFPTKFQENRVVNIGNQLYFWGKEGGEFDNQLFVFDGIDNTFKRVVDVPVHSVYYFKNLPTIVLKTGQVRILDPKNGYESYFVMDIDFDKNQSFNFYDWGSFFIINSQNQVYYSDGDCQSSGVVDVPKREGFWYSIKINNNYYVLRNQSESLICKGKNAVSFPQQDYQIIGASNKNVYYTIGIGDNISGWTNKYGIYQYNFTTSTRTFIDTVSGYNNSNFRVLEKGRKWEFISGSSQFTITDGGKSIDKIEISQFSNYPYSTIIFKGNNNTTLFHSGKELVLRNNAQNTILMTLNSDEYWQQNFKSVYYQQSEEYIYLSVLTINNNAGLIKKVVRISKQDFSLKTIDVPFGVRVFRTSSQTEPYYPIVLGADRLYAIIESPNEGRQLWLLDEAKQTQKVPEFTSQRDVVEDFVGNKDCATKRLNQLIPTTKVEQYGIFPNPTSKYLFLNLPFDQRQSIERIEIFDSIGRLISNEITQNTFSINPDLISLSLPNLSTGMYFLRVNLTSDSLNFKFMVE